MLIKSGKQLVGIPMLFLLCLTSNLGQRNRNPSLFSSVPVELQPSLRTQLKAYIHYERVEDYERLYGLLSENTKHPRITTIDVHSPAESVIEYVKYRRTHYPKLLGFKVESIVKSHSYPGAYEIRGNATLRYKYGTGKAARLILAWPVNGVWFFSGLLEEHIEVYEEKPISPPASR